MKQRPSWFTYRIFGMGKCLRLQSLGLVNELSPLDYCAFPHQTTLPEHSFQVKMSAWLGSDKDPLLSCTQLFPCLLPSSKDS